MASSNSSRRLRIENLRVEPTAHPGWSTGVDRVPAVGERVQCADGVAEVVRVLGRTGDGSRLLELSLEDRPQPFFAAASNVLVERQRAKRSRRR